MSEAVVAPVKPAGGRPPKTQSRGRYVELGMSVYWYPCGDKSLPHAAFVVGIGTVSVNLNIMMPNIHNFMTQDGVRHHDDQGTKSSEIQELGTWDYTGLTRAMLEMMNVPH